MSGSSTFAAWARLHIFRTVTAVLTLVLLGLCFFYDPELITWWLRTTMRMIEFVAALLPYPWGDQVEITLKALGGSFWFQIASAIILVRAVLWGIAAGWRHQKSRRRARAGARREPDRLD
ncbi:MAG TPA: hypothetical protein VKB68_22220 [Stellaceae bacterium]|nr:hypothetical protein [Stellaceae bacterium]